MQVAVPCGNRISWGAALQRAFPADHLPTFREMFARLPPGAAHVGRWDLVIDTNVIIRELLWLAKHRPEKPTIRTRLQESLVAGVVAPIAPEQLRTEVAKHLPIIAAKKGLNLDFLQSLWKEYQGHLVFQPVVRNEEIASRLDDPDDSTFVQLSQITGAPVLPEDKGFQTAGVPWVRSPIMEFFRDYGRAKTAEIGSLLSVSIVILMTGSVVVGATACLLRFFRRRPFLTILLLSVAGTIVWCFRDKIKRVFHKMFSRKTRECLLHGFAAFLEACHAQAEAAAIAERGIQEALAR